MASGNGTAPLSPAIEGQADPVTVLVIDDEPAFCFAITEVLRISGYQVLEAHTVAQAREVLAGHVPDLILTDVMMPGVDGLTFLRSLRDDARLAAVPTVAISAKAMLADIDAAKEAGADGYLTKPFSARELKEVVQHHLNAI
jgi:CheY-like chemotaxis protein